MTARANLPMARFGRGIRFWGVAALRGQRFTLIPRLCFSTDVGGDHRLHTDGRPGLRQQFRLQDVQRGRDWTCRKRLALANDLDTGPKPSGIDSCAAGGCVGECMSPSGFASPVARLALGGLMRCCRL